MTTRLPTKLSPSFLVLYENATQNGQEDILVFYGSNLRKMIKPPAQSLNLSMDQRICGLL